MYVKVAVVGDSHVEVPIGFALTVTVYDLIQSSLVARPNKILGTFGSGREIRFEVLQAVW